MVRTRVGYCGGTTAAPTYRRIGDHSEAIQIDFDPSRIRFEQLLALFWREHDYGREAGSRQYRKAIFASEAQLPAALASLEALRAQGRTVFTRVEPLGQFTLAETYHQKYRLRLREAWMAEFARAGYSDAQVTDSTVAARANAYVAGPSEQLRQVLAAQGLDVLGEPGASGP